MKDYNYFNNKIMWLQYEGYKKIFTFWIFSILLVNIVQAQTLQRLEITQVPAPEQGVAVFMDYPDKAAIIIESPITTLRFSSNMNGIVREMHEAERGRYVLIIEPFTQILVIDAPGFIQQRQRIGNPQPREVRYFEVKPEERVSELISVIFNVEPSDARLFVNGQETPVNQTTQLAPGSVEVRLEREGYRTITDVVEINDQNIQFNYSLEEIDIVLVEIRSNVEGASVIIDGTSRGEIDRSGTLGLFLYPGTYSLQVMQQGYVTKTVPLEVSEEGRNEVTVNLVRNIGELVLNIDPSDASVSLNRMDYTGQRVIELAPGKYRLDVEKEYYESYSETVEIILDQRLSRDITLVPHTGSLQFRITPNDARVELMNERGHTVNQWVGTQLLRDLKAGTYTLRVTAEGHIPKEQGVNIQKDQMNQVSIELEERSPEYRNRDQNTKVVEVTNPETGRTWMDRNLGASRAATSSTDEEAYGDLYQWGRAADGHQKRNSGTRSTLSNSDQPGHGEFILAPNSPFDWRSPQNDNLWQGEDGINNSCPAGYRLPTEAEWNTERQSWSSNDAAGAFASPLKLPLSGGRYFSYGSLNFVGSFGFYWSSTVSGPNARRLLFNSSSANMFNFHRAYGFAVRCTKD